MSAWTVRDVDRDNERQFDNRADAEDALEDLQGLGAEVELIPPSDSDDGTEPVAAEVVNHNPPAETEPDTVTVDNADPERVVRSSSDVPGADDLPERSVAEDPLTWVPGEFVDEIDGTQAINRKGFEVLSHFYDISVHSELQVPPEEQDHEYCRVKATATTEDGRECEAFGSAHVDRGDDPELLLEMADTRARKRALSIATGVGAVAVAELKNEVDR